MAMKKPANPKLYWETFASGAEVRPAHAVALRRRRWQRAAGLWLR